MHGSHDYLHPSIIYQARVTTDMFLMTIRVSLFRGRVRKANPGFNLAVFKIVISVPATL
jgi:hypothetical protein